jgi:cysteine-rich repeat protein
MLKGEIKDLGKIRVFLVSIAFFFLINLCFVSAADVAYIVVRQSSVIDEYIEVLEELERDYEIIPAADILDYNLSEYRLMLLNNEYFNNWDEIPVNDFPAAVVNGRHMDDWGWTKRMSVASQEEPYRINVNTSHEIGQGFNEIEQAYIDDAYKNTHTPDVYYLDKRDVFRGIDIAVSNIYDNKDVIIGTADSGTTLTRAGLPDTEVHANTCFFGISESQYWTNESRELFKRCIEFASLSCFTNEHCPSTKYSDIFCENDRTYQNITTYSCVNPGTSDAECMPFVTKELVQDCGQDSCDPWQDNYCQSGDVWHNRTCYDRGCSDGICFNNANIEQELVEDCDSDEICSNGQCIDLPIICSDDNDCGTGHWLGNEICSGSDVYDEWMSFNCVNPGTPQSYCTNSTELKLKENCTNFCFDGECVDCLQDEDCPDDFFGQPYCQGEDVYNNFTDYFCLDNQCSFNITPVLNETCSDICLNGKCEEITCSLNSECGLNGFIGGKYCENNNAYQDFLSFTCFFPGTISSFCYNYTLPILMDYCEGVCISGECINCFSDIDCGEDGYIGQPYCQGDDVWQDYQEFLCSNPGTINSNCSSDIFPKLVENCSDKCINGQCVDIECYNNSDCDDINPLTYDECINPGTPISECRNTPINCLDDSDCGITGFIGEEYCFLGMVYKNYKNSICVNNGTLDSYCNITISPEFINDCGQDSCENWTDNYCIGNEVWHNRTCYDRGCENGSCFTELYEDSELVDECEYGCIDGECINECEVDGDCDDGLWCNGPEACIDNSCVQGTGPCTYFVDICTEVTCNEQEDRCEETPIPGCCIVDGDCDDGLWCNGPEACIDNSCQAGADIDCSDFDIFGIATCNNNPDNNPLTWDFRQEFISVCDENIDSCTFGSNDILHTCNISCGAECIDAGDCPCPNDYCDDTTLVDYPDYGECGVSGAEKCLCQDGTEQGENCEPILIENSTICGFVPPYCGNGIIDLSLGEECDDGNINNNDNCKNDCTLNICGDGILYIGVEECDDGNLINGDGCNETCMIEEIILCYNDSDCGTDGWIVDYYCGGVGNEDVYRDYVNYTCINPGTPISSCEQEVEDILVGDCFLGCSDGVCLGCI